MHLGLRKLSGPGMASHEALMDWLADGDRACFPSPSHLVSERAGRVQLAEAPRSPEVQPCPWTPRTQKMLEMETSPPAVYRPTEYKREGTMERKRQVLTILGWSDVWTFIGGWDASPGTLSAALRAADDAQGAPGSAKSSVATAPPDSASPGQLARQPRVIPHAP
jgi:hypothetical protein